nr:MAG TPA: hypothetical protein [Caudoviricetes sp.]
MNSRHVDRRGVDPGGRAENTASKQYGERRLR